MGPLSGMEMSRSRVASLHPTGQMWHAGKEALCSPKTPDEQKWNMERNICTKGREVVKILSLSKLVTNNNFVGYTHVAIYANNLNIIITEDRLSNLCSLPSSSKM